MKTKLIATTLLVEALTTSVLAHGNNMQGMNCMNGQMMEQGMKMHNNMNLHITEYLNSVSRNT